MRYTISIILSKKEVIALKSLPFTKPIHENVFLKQTDLVPYFKLVKLGLATWNMNHLDIPRDLESLEFSYRMGNSRHFAITKMGQKLLKEIDRKNRAK